MGEGKFLFEKQGEAGPEWMELPNGTYIIQYVDVLLTLSDVRLCMLYCAVRDRG